MKKIKKLNMEGLSKKDQAAMKKHSSHHSVDHMLYMIGVMRKGGSFKKAHELAMKKIGK